jgi:hypothetical protein
MWRHIRVFALNRMLVHGLCDPEGKRGADLATIQRLSLPIMFGQACHKDQRKRVIEICFFFISLHTNGLMAEWLGRGLQNLLQRFESA